MRAPQMSLKLVLLILLVLAAFLGSAPGMFGEARIAAFGRRVNDGGAQAKRLFREFGRQIISGAVGFAVLYSLFTPNVPAKPPWSSGESVVDLVLFILAVGIPIGVVLLALLIAAALAVLWTVGHLLSVLPTSTRAIATSTFVVLLAAAAVTYELA
jgi:hypothetical protein